MRTRRDIARGLGWVAAAGLLALLVSTNCGTTDQMFLPEACGADAACPRGGICDVRSNRCSAGLCSNGDASMCPSETTCYPPTGPGECKPPDQFGCFYGGVPPPGDSSFCTPGLCPSGYACATITVHRHGALEPQCGCVPSPTR
jgi:hypothetical protein